jgi:hypothetical protein
LRSAIDDDGMAPSPVDLVLGALAILLALLLAAVAIAAAVGIPAFVGKTVYDRAETEELSNPAAIAVGAAFFATLVGLFAIGVLLVYVG